MSRTFVYASVSSLDQNPENQIREIEAAGIYIEPHLIISSSQKLSPVLWPLHSGKGFLGCLIKSKKAMSSSSPNWIDSAVMTLMSAHPSPSLRNSGIRVHCLALGVVDLTSSAGKMTMHVINAVAKFERDLLIQRTKSCLARAKAAGRTLGRPSVLSTDQQNKVKGKIRNGETISAIAREFGPSRQTIMRVRDQT